MLIDNFVDNPSNLKRITKSMKRSVLPYYSMFHKTNPIESMKIPKLPLFYILICFVRNCFVIYAFYIMASLQLISKMVD